MKPTFTRTLIMVNALGWSAVLLVAFPPSPALSSTVCAVDLAVIGYCGWTLACMHYRKRG